MATEMAEEPKIASDSAAEPAASAPAPESNAVPEVEQLGKHQVKIKKPGQRSCNEKDAKGKICAGHLKRWYYSADIVEQECGDLERHWGENAEVYRCEHCRMLYKPAEGEDQQPNVAGRGILSIFGFTVPPKSEK